MILSGILQQVGSGTVVLDSGSTIVEAIQVSGHRELRSIRLTRYLHDHLMYSVGEEVVLGLFSGTLVAIKRQDGSTYEDVGFLSMLQANFGKLAVIGLVFAPALVIAIPVLKVLMSRTARQTRLHASDQATHRVATGPTA